MFSTCLLWELRCGHGSSKVLTSFAFVYSILFDLRVCCRGLPATCCCRGSCFIIHDRVRGSSCSQDFPSHVCHFYGNLVPRSLHLPATSGIYSGNAQPSPRRQRPRGRHTRRRTTITSLTRPRQRPQPAPQLSLQLRNQLAPNLTHSTTATTSPTWPPHSPRNSHTP